MLVKLKLFLILKKRNPTLKSLLNFIENDLDHFLKRNGLVIMSYEVREE